LAASGQIHGAEHVVDFTYRVGGDYDSISEIGYVTDVVAVDTG